MATKPKSEAVEEFRREIAAYLNLVRRIRSWKDVELGKMAGGLSHTTIGRARKGEHTLGYPAILALEASSGVPIPDTLKGAAIRMQQPPEVQEAPTAEELRRIRAEFEKQSPAVQRALLDELTKAVAKAG